LELLLALAIMEVPTAGEGEPEGLPREPPGQLPALADFHGEPFMKPPGWGLPFGAVTGCVSEEIIRCGKGADILFGVLAALADLDDGPVLKAPPLGMPRGATKGYVSEELFNCVSGANSLLGMREEPPSCEVRASLYHGVSAEYD
jgi:hypothetical protein